MTTLNDNYNTSTSASFILIVPEHEHLNYFVQRTSLPGMRESAVQGNFANNSYRVPGETIEYDTLTLDILVDENYNNVVSLQNWLIESKSKEKAYARRLRDITLIIKNRNGANALEFTFYGAFPVDIGAISLDSTLNDVEIPICNVTFEYQYYRKSS